MIKTQIVNFLKKDPKNRKNQKKIKLINNLLKIPIMNLIVSKKVLIQLYPPILKMIKVTYQIRDVNV